MIDALTNQDAREIINERFYSGEWWLIVIASKAGSELCFRVEDRFYRGKNNDYFEMVILPAGILGPLQSTLIAVALCRKEEMDRDSLEQVMEEMGGDCSNDGEDRDVIIPWDRGDRELVEGIAVILSRWLMDRPELN